MSEWINVKDQLPKIGQKVMIEWQPIETAPKDGTEIVVLVRYPETIEPEKVKYQPTNGDNRNWVNDYERFHESSIIGWMPIPEKPKKTHHCNNNHIQKNFHSFCQSNEKGELFFYNGCGCDPVKINFCAFCGEKA